MKKVFLTILLLGSLFLVGCQRYPAEKLNHIKVNFDKQLLGEIEIIDYNVKFSYARRTYFLTVWYKLKESTYVHPKIEGFKVYKNEVVEAIPEEQFSYKENLPILIRIWNMNNEIFQTDFSCGEVSFNLGALNAKETKTIFLM